MPARLAALVLLAWLLAACCPCAKPPRVPPAPISLDQQVREVQDWARQFPQLRATIGTAGAHLQFRDDKGHEESFLAEGRLYLRQHPDAAPGSPESRGDVYLRGDSFSNKVFEAGRNPTDWWFVIWYQTNTAWTGDASRPVNLARLGGTPSGTRGILRADLVPELLALSPLPVGRATADAGLRPGMPGILVMRVEDAANVLVQVEAAEQGRPYLAREISVDRFTGHVTGVRMFTPDGVVVVESQLADYRAIVPAEGAPAAGTPLFPHQVTVRYPQQHAVIELKFSEVTVPAEMRDSTFRTPDFKDLQVIHTP